MAGSLGINPRRTAHAVNVLTAEVRLATVVRAAPAVACAASQDRRTGRLRLANPGVRHPLPEKVEQRPQVAEVGATGVVGTATLQREILVELLENRVHSPTFADADAVPQVTRRSTSGVRSLRVG